MGSQSRGNLLLLARSVSNLDIVRVVEVQQNFLHARLEGRLAEERAAAASEGVALVALHAESPNYIKTSQARRFIKRNKNEKI